MSHVEAFVTRIKIYLESKVISELQKSADQRY